MNFIKRASAYKVFSSAVAGLLAVSVLSACSPTTMSVSNANPTVTGTLESEGEYGALTHSQTVRGETVYVASEQLRLRKTPEVTEANLAGILVMNDALKIMNSNRIGDDEFIAVRVLSGSADLHDKTVYASAKYLNPKRTGVRLSPSTGSTESTPSHFVITNVATEMIRVYRRCVAPEACRNKMLMQFHGTVGNDSGGRRSDVGVYKVTSWTKFYELPGEYPGWYRPGYPALPPPGSRSGWLSSKAKPSGFSGPRGAFGWYTAFVGPNNDGQWMHGTTGWGADKSKMVRFQDSFWGGVADVFAKLGSHGCTRMSNEAIAYMRSNLPVGAAYIKIYARERVKDSSLIGYSRDLGHFPYIITTLGAGKSNSLHDLASRASVLAAGTPQSEWLEQGTFDYDQTPQAMGGDHYGVNAFYGALNVDDGTLTSDYRHPNSSKLNVGGYPGRESALPMFVRDQAPAAAPEVVSERE